MPSYVVEAAAQPTHPDLAKSTTHNDTTTQRHVALRRRRRCRPQMRKQGPRVVQLAYCYIIYTLLPFARTKTVAQHSTRNICAPCTNMCTISTTYMLFSPTDTHTNARNHNIMYLSRLGMSCAHTMLGLWLDIDSRHYGYGYEQYIIHVRECVCVCISCFSHSEAALQTPSGAHAVIIKVM